MGVDDSVEQYALTTAHRVAYKFAPMKLSDQVRQAIRRSGRTEYSLAVAMKIHPSALNRFLNRKHNLSMATLDVLAELLGLSLAKPVTPSTRRK
jgi:transcriptional regulator with XRE-family HTH domain